MLSANSDLVSQLASQGLLGGLVIAFITGLVVPSWALKQAREEAARERAEKTALRQSIDEKLLPALQQSSSVLSEAIRALDRKTP